MLLLVDVEERELLLAQKEASKKLLVCNQRGGWQAEENTRLVIILFLNCAVYNSESSLSCWQVSYQAHPRNSLFSLLLLKFFLPIIAPFRGMLAHKGRCCLLRNLHVKYLSYTGTMTRIKRAQKGVVLPQIQKKSCKWETSEGCDVMCVAHTNMINT